MAAIPTRLSISDAVDEILKRQRVGGMPQPGGVAPAQARPAPPQPDPQPGLHYGSLYAAPPNDLAELRQQQAEFARTAHDLDLQNSWMAIPAVAPAATVLGLEGAAALASRLFPQALRADPLVLTKRDPTPKVGDFWATRAGRRAHQAFAARVDAKPGWKAEETIETESGKVRPDARLPPRDPVNPARRFQLELKPDTPSGHRAAAKAVERYNKATGQKTRAVFYNPKDYM